MARRCAAAHSHPQPPWHQLSAAPTHALTLALIANFALNPTPTLTLSPALAPPLKLAFAPVPALALRPALTRSATRPLKLALASALTLPVTLVLAFALVLTPPPALLKQVKVWATEWVQRPVSRAWYTAEMQRIVKVYIAHQWRVKTDRQMHKRRGFFTRHVVAASDYFACKAAGNAAEVVVAELIASALAVACAEHLEAPCAVGQVLGDGPSARRTPARCYCPGFRGWKWGHTCYSPACRARFAPTTSAPGRVAFIPAGAHHKGIVSVKTDFAAALHGDKSIVQCASIAESHNNAVFVLGYAPKLIQTEALPECKAKRHRRKRGITSVYAESNLTVFVFSKHNNDKDYNATARYCIAHIIKTGRPPDDIKSTWASQAKLLPGSAAFSEQDGDDYDVYHNGDKLPYHAEPQKFGMGNVVSRITLWPARNSTHRASKASALSSNFFCMLAYAGRVERGARWLCQPVWVRGCTTIRTKLRG